MPRRDSNLAIVGQAVAVEAFYEIVELQTMNCRRPRSSDFLHGGYDPEDSFGLEMLDGILEDRARSDPILAPEEHDVENLFDARQRPCIHDHGFLVLCAGCAQEVCQRLRRIHEKQPGGPGELEPGRKRGRVFQGDPAHGVALRQDTGTGTGFALFGGEERGEIMLWTVFVILLILWLLGFSVWHLGALIHLLLVAAVIVLVIRLIQGRPV